MQLHHQQLPCPMYFQLVPQTVFQSISMPYRISRIKEIQFSWIEKE
jgi:hypothetical protein